MRRFSQILIVASSEHEARPFNQNRDHNDCYYRRDRHSLLPLAVTMDLGRCELRQKNTLHQLQAAMEAYRVECGRYPGGKPAEIFRALYGNNPGHITFWEPDPKRTQSSGQLTDPWGTPHRIDLADSEHVVLRSAGPNRRFDDSPNADDISDN